ncbi:MAG: tetratricopeptide repeat protein, partial [Gammaproteobacteria bacterium]|nr:tetratricopeptide repeat protein [Gammaproteobacteria bacterium]
MTSIEMDVEHRDIKVFYFRDVKLDTVRRELYRAGKPVSVQPRVFDLLLFLLQSRDRVVTKEEIQEHIWPNVIVTETALTRAIMKARRAVGDDAEAQEIIRTVHGHGYRFIASLEDDIAEPPAQSAAETARTTAWPVTGVVLLLLFGLVALITSFLPITSQAPNAVRIAILPVENQVDDPDFDWTRFGLMGLLEVMFQEESQVQTVSAQSVVSVIENVSLPVDITNDDMAADLFDIFWRAFGATHVLATELQNTEEGFQLNYRIVGDDGERSGSVTGADTLEVAQALERMVMDDLGGSTRESPYYVSDDNFVNKAYARARSARFQGSLAEAQDLYEVVLNATPDAFWPRAEYASLLRTVGQVERAGELFEELLASTETQSDPYKYGYVLNSYAGVKYRQGNPEEAMQYLVQAVAIAEEVGFHDKVGRNYTNMALTTWRMGDLQMAREYVRKSLVAYERGGFTTPPPVALQTLGLIEKAERRYEDASRVLSQAVEGYQLIGSRRSAATTSNSLGIIEWELWRLDRSAAVFEHVSNELRELKGDNVLSVVMANYAYTKYTQRDLLAAEQIAGEAAALANKTNHYEGEAVALQVLAKVHLAREDYATAAEYLDKAFPLFERAGRNDQIMLIKLQQAKIALEAGDSENATVLIDDVFAQAQPGEDPEPRVQALLLRAE